MTSISGTSRRSHTKSRKGCSTCKKRHIRCDEVFPQCRNCTKHQVRCDYMEIESREDTPETATAGRSASPDIDRVIKSWQALGVATLGELSIGLHEQSYEYSSSDLRMMYFVLLAGQSAESGEFTVWTNSFAQGFAAAKRHTFLMHSIFAFTAFSLAFDSGSRQVKEMAYQYSGVALQGLQNAIGQFSADNADAILLASRLLAWQANDWRSWASLTAGIRTVVTSMRNFQEASTIPHIVDMEDNAIPHTFPNFPQVSITVASYNHYNVVLRSCSAALDALAPYISRRGQESLYIEYLGDYVRRLAGAPPASTVEQQFNHLYALRKWLFFVPALLLRNPNKDLITLVVIAHFYAVALSMDDLFPNVAPVFLSSIAITPLQEIVNAVDARMALDRSLATVQTVFSFPRKIALGAIDRAEGSRNINSDRGIMFSFEGVQQHLANAIEPPLRGHRSPAFGQFPAQAQPSPSYSSMSTSYLEESTSHDNVPQIYGQDRLELSMEPEDMDSEPVLEGVLPGGFVASPSSRVLWT